MSNLVMVVAMTLNLNEFNLHAVVENVYYCCDLDRGQTDLVNA